MNKSDKYLQKLPEKEREAILGILRQIMGGDLSSLDLKKIKGYDNYFRVRKGHTRIIFHLDRNGIPEIRHIGRKDDNTYKDLQ
ncbi:MAG: hypothetical protein KGI45_02145 [Patescibacteria group bacterium]|nr:hypothetical protein [Patescibacteria group bacterium]MDE1941426.1 hypothetical protein [Patescibacteria group bacterium]MDE1966853.1 hypothetical protein [Patescibacteria group bacterium]